MCFYSREDENYPDQVDITIVARDMTAENCEVVSQGVYVFIDIYLGELTYVEDIDLFKIVSPDEAAGELIPIAKLKDVFDTAEERVCIEV